MMKVIYRTCTLVLFCLIRLQSHAQEATADTLPDTLIVQVQPVDVPEVPVSEIDSFDKQRVKICGVITDAKVLKKEKGRPVLISLQGNEEKARTRLRVRFVDASRFKKRPDKMLEKKRLCFTGTIFKNVDYTEIFVDSSDEQILLITAEATPPSAIKPQSMVKQPLQTNAYLFAGPGLDEAIITHLKQGTIVIPLYFKRAWAYVRVVEKVNTDETPVALNGFIRKSSLDLKGKVKKVKLD